MLNNFLILAKRTLYLFCVEINKFICIVNNIALRTITYRKHADLPHA